MKILGMDTSEDACSAALLIGDVVDERFELAPRRHSELILPMMDGLLANAGLEIRDLDALAFACGPGSFTGVRIAASIIQGAALGSGLGVVPVSSLQALAQGVAREYAAEAVCSALDARMQEVYWGAYRADAAGIMRAVIDDMVCAPERVAIPDDGPWVGAGSGWKSYAGALGSRCGADTVYHGDALVHARDVVLLARPLFEEGGAVPAERALPVYLRNEVAWAKQT